MRRHRATALGVGLALVGVCAGPIAAPAQSPPPATASAADPAFEAAKRAFDALAEADRRAIQDGLAWTGDYKGLVDGVFGRGGRAAIIAFAQRSGLPVDGTLNARGRALLAAAAQNARAAVGFATTRDARSGASLGLPLKTLTKRADAKGGSRWSSADGALSLETAQTPESEASLQAMFDRLKEPAPNRRLTYRLSKPDFFIVSGEMGKSTFYTRAARGVVNGAPVVRLYTFAYPTGSKGLDALSIAVANAFDPFPSPAAASAVANAPPPPPPPTRPPTPLLAATAVAVDAHRALTSLRVCADPKLGREPARIVAQDGASGLMLLEAAGAALPSLSPSAAGPAGDAELLVFVSAAQGPGVETLVAPGAPTQGSGGLRLRAALGGAPSGGAVFDRSGALVGLVGALSAPTRVAGSAARATWPLVAAPALSAFLSGAGVVAKPASAPATRTSAADLAALARGAVLPVWCGP